VNNVGEKSLESKVLEDSDIVESSRFAGAGSSDDVDICASIVSGKSSGFSSKVSELNSRADSRSDAIWMGDVDICSGAGSGDKVVG
jgi:hypothetical protein